MAKLRILKPKPDPTLDPWGFLRETFDHRIDDESDVLGSIRKRSQLIRLQLKQPGGSITDRLERMNKAFPLMKETLGMIAAYNTIVHDEAA